MVDLKNVAEELVRLSGAEVQAMAKTMKEEYDIEVGAQNVCFEGNNKVRLSRRERRKCEREAQKREAKKRQKRG